MIFKHENLNHAYRQRVRHFLMPPHCINNQSTQKNDYKKRNEKCVFDEMSMLVIHVNVKKTK